jgi:hypothetical protein
MTIALMEKAFVGPAFEGSGLDADPYLLSTGGHSVNGGELAS